MSCAADHVHGSTFIGTRSQPLILFTVLRWAQGAYCFVTGVWPLVRIQTFLVVAGRKTDHFQIPNPTEYDHLRVMAVSVLAAPCQLRTIRPYPDWDSGNPRFEQE